MAIILSWLVWLSAGIKDSAAVATQSLAWIAVVVMSHHLLSAQPVRLVVRLAIGFGYLMIGLFAVKWFFVSPYLSGGPTWNSEIQRATEVCRSEGIEEVELQLSLATVEFPCAKIR